MYNNNNSSTDIKTDLHVCSIWALPALACWSMKHDVHDSRDSTWAACQSASLQRTDHLLCHGSYELRRKPLLLYLLPTLLFWGASSIMSLFWRYGLVKAARKVSTSVEVRVRVLLFVTAATEQPWLAWSATVQASQCGRCRATGSTHSIIGWGLLLLYKVPEHIWPECRECYMLSSSVSIVL